MRVVAARCRARVAGAPWKSDATSSNTDRASGSSGSRRIGALGVAVHDAAAALLPSGVFLFGGGDGVRQHAEIVRVDPASGRSTVVEAA